MGEHAAQILIAMLGDDEPRTHAEEVPRLIERASSARQG